MPIRTMLDNTDDYYVVAVIGYRNVRFDTVECIKRLRIDLTTIRDQLKRDGGKPPALLADGTDIGVAGLAYREARSLGFTILGLTPAKCLDPIFPMDDHRYVACGLDFDSDVIAFQYAAISDCGLYYGKKHPTSNIIRALNNSRIDVIGYYLAPTVVPLKKPPPLKDY